MERANLKERQKEVYEKLATKWLEWNQTMLPEVEESGTGGNNGQTWADHVGSPPATRTPDNPAPPTVK